MAQYQYGQGGHSGGAYYNAASGQYQTLTYPMGPSGQVASIDPQIQQWFMAVDTDRSGKISALELQKALVNGNWTQFNEDVCRKMIGMFDKDRSGTIDAYEFQALWHYIQQWKQTFDRYDVNRSGSIEGQELQQAFQTMGYSVTPQFVQIILLKFDYYNRRSLTLDNFIQCCILLKSLTDAFRARDPTQSGAVRLSYDDFLCLAASC